MEAKLNSWGDGGQVKLGCCCLIVHILLRLDNVET